MGTNIIPILFLSAIVIVVAWFLWAVLVINKKEKEKTSNSKSCLSMILCIIVAIIALVIMGKCSRDSSPWQPRHTQIEKPVLNVVNELNFNNYTVS